MFAGFLKTVLWTLLVDIVLILFFSEYVVITRPETKIKLGALALPRCNLAYFFFLILTFFVLDFRLLV